ncbi:MAG: tRNA nucleotidyltransferase [Flavobacteriales bacterium]|nr:MAG: tRNA nucleotidyltransferase [Flavobacteriales bacterium]
MQQNFSKALTHSVFSFITNAAQSLNAETYVIGGFVRDLLLKRKQTDKDVDIVVVGNGIALAKKTAQLLPGKPKVQIFKTYGTAMLKHADTQIEFVGARKESYSKESRNPKVAAGTLEDDQNRRDFTINALAISLNTETYGRLIDPFNGLKDLEKGIIKTPLNPDVTYSDDPLRMLRAIRFATQLNFKIEKKSLQAIKKNAHRIKIISRERIVEELHKILMADKPSVGFKLLDKTGLLRLILPELTALKGVEEEKGQTHKDNFYHTLQVVDNIAQNTDNLWLRTFHSHEFVGSKMVYKLFKRLKMPLNDKMKYVQKLVLLSSRPVILAEDVTDSAVRRLIFDAGDDIDDLMTHCEADITTKNPNRKRRYLNNFAKVRQKIADVEERDQIRNFQPPISGELIMETFNLKPSREIGIIKDAVKEAILEGEIKNDYNEAYFFMLKKAEELGLKKVK